jgi:hypothetical protein
MSLNRKMIKKLDGFQAALEAEYKKRCKNPGELARFDSIANEKLFNWEIETSNEVFGWSFTSEKEVEVRKILIEHFEFIKHELSGIPAELKLFALVATIDAFEDYMANYWHENMYFGPLERCLRSSALTVEAVLSSAQTN